MRLYTVRIKRERNQGLILSEETYAVVAQNKACAEDVVRARCGNCQVLNNQQVADQTCLVAVTYLIDTIS